MSTKSSNEKKNQPTLKEVVDYWNIPKSTLVGTNINKNSSNKDKNNQDDFSRLRTLYEDNSQKINDAHGAIELLPDLALVIQTAVATTLSPIDLTKVDITFNVHQNSPETLSSTLNKYFNNKDNFDLSTEASKILSESKYYYGAYITIFIQPNMINKIINLNTKIRKDSIQPSYYDKVPGLPIVNNNGDLINQEKVKLTDKKSNESFSISNEDIINGKCNIGLIKNGKKEFEIVGNESINTLEYFSSHKEESKLLLNEGLDLKGLNSINLSQIELTDNPFILAKSYANEYLVEQKTSSILSSLGFEGYDDNLSTKIKSKRTNSNGFKLDENKDNIYLNRETETIPTQNFTNIDITEEEKIQFNPILLKGNPESVIPIIKPGKPDEHIGYFIILDENGHQLSCTKDSNYFKTLTQKLKEKILNTGNNSMFFQSPTFKLEDQIAFKPLIDKYLEQFEEKLSNVIKDSLMLSELKIDFPEELFTVMLTRQLTNQKTRVLYLPKDLVSYIAFNFNDNGIGVSLLEKTKLYTSLRAILLFASIIAGINNSIPAKKMSIKLDEDDIAPRERIEDIMEIYAKLQSGTLQIGTLQPYDLIESLQKASISVEIEGGEQFPNTKVEMLELPKTQTKPDQELMEYLKHAQYAGLEETPEVVDSTYEGEFAISIVNRNLLRARRFLDAQIAFTSKKHGLSEFVQKYILAGGTLFKEIKDLYDSLPAKDKEEMSFKDMINSIEVKLPAPDLSIVNARAAALEDFNKLAEQVISAYISEDMIGDLLKGEEIQTSAIDAIKLAVLKKLQREFIKANNILPELEDLLYNEDIKIETELGEHYNFMMKLIADVLKIMRKAEPKYNDMVKKVEDALLPKEDISEEDTTTDEGTDNLESDNEESNDEFSDLEEESNTDNTTTEEPTTEEDTSTTEDTTENDTTSKEDNINLDEVK